MMWVMKVLTILSLVAVMSSASNKLKNLKQKSLKTKKANKIGSLSSVLELRGGSSSLDFSSLDWRFFLAGGICAACSHGYTTPIDVVKTRMQAYPEKYKNGVIAAARDIVATEGLGFLLTGLGPTVIGYGLEGALKFGCYETFKQVFKTLTPYKVANFLLASVLAGAVASVVLCPMEEARIKMVGDKSWSKENTLSAITRMVKEDGLLSSFGGLAAMLSKQVPYTMGKQVSFDFFAAMLYTAVAHFALSQNEAKWLISIAAAFLSSIMACIFSQPGDMILTATYKSTPGTPKSSFGGIVSKIYKQHGLGGFYLGLQARLAHVASIITAQLVLYDLIKAALGLPVTGSH